MDKILSPFRNWQTIITLPLWIVLIFNSIPAKGYVISIDAATESECFHESVTRKVKLGFSFEVIDGGFYDVDVTILDPNNNIVHQDDKTSSGKFTFEADLDGSYNFCFGNKQSSKSPKMIMFDIDRSDNFSGTGKVIEAGVADKTTPDEETLKLKEMVNSLLLAVTTTRHDVRYLTARDKVHRQINENSNSRILWWSGAEFILLLCVSLGQVWYLKRFFETRRKI